jgi:hypothetical protein
MKKHRVHVSLSAVVVMMVFNLLPSLAQAQSQEDRACSNRTLRGDYGFDIQAQLAFGGLHGVAMTHFDGRGNLSQVDHVVVDGIPPPTPWNAGKGTYIVHPDCTGTAIINFADGIRPPVMLSLVVVRDGTEVHTVVDNPGTGPGIYGTSVGIRRD